ncbi:MAG TPA: hypothetical protein PL029_11285 [Bacteroidia bacterium]|nr:hypothetical protein [Bacteroidia bacterium]
MKKLFIMAVLSMGLANTILAQKPEIITSDKKGWHKIGETTVDFKTDHDEIAVLGADKFKALLFKVTDAPIHLIRGNISYESGTGEDFKMDYPVQAAGESQVIYIKGGEREIKRINFVYRTLPNREDDKAHVEIWGLKTNADKKSK